MYKYFKTISITITVFIFLALAFGSGDSDEKIVINISDKQALEKYIQGKWSWEKHTGDVNMTWRYRFEIIGNTLRIWKCVNNTEDPFDMSEGYEELHFNLGEPTRDVDGYNARYLEFGLFDKTNFFGLTYENLAPFWLVSDDNWDTPVLRCASGIPSWSREEFQAFGNKISHNESNSNIVETYNESNYSNSSSDYSEETQTMENSKKNKIMTFKKCNCGAQSCMLDFIDDDGKHHEFAIESISNYDFNCPSGDTYKNVRFEIVYETTVTEYEQFTETIENLISINIVKK